MIYRFGLYIFDEAWRWIGGIEVQDTLHCYTDGCRIVILQNTSSYNKQLTIFSFCRFYCTCPYPRILRSSMQSPFRSHNDIYTADCVQKYPVDLADTAGLHSM